MRGGLIALPCTGCARHFRALALLAAALGLAALPQPTLAANRPAAIPVIPELTPWLGKLGKPGAAAWRHAAHFSIPYETYPELNAPAPVSTRLDAGYTAHALWLRFLARDPHPAQILGRYREHDDISSDSDDYVGVFLSPFDDLQWAYEFMCTAGGTEWDAFRQQNNEYSSWDAVWSCSASRTASGYTVVMKIPFASIKFPHSGQPQRWALMFFRNWPRNLRHQLLSRPINYDSSCTLCSLMPMRTAGPIETRPTDVQVIPAVTLIRTDTRKGSTSGLAQGSPRAKASLDVRWILRPDLEWAATVNPNFSEVAPDVLQLSANRQFALYYKENRPFFEQGVQVFNTPSLRLGSDTFSPSGTLVDTLAISDPRYATKLVGQVGKNALGALATEDTVTTVVLPGAQSSASRTFDFSTRDALLRYRRDVGASAFGLFASDRTGGGYDSGLYAADGNWQIDPSDTVTALVGSSTTDYPQAVASAFAVSPGTVRGALWTLDYARTRRNYLVDVDLSHIDPGFRADLGYLPQVGFDQDAFLGEYDFYASDRHWWQIGGFGTVSNWTRSRGGGPDLDRKVKLYAFVHAHYQTQIHLYATRDEQYYRGRTFTLGQYEIDAQTQPTGWLNGEVDVVGGDGIDYIGARKGALLSVSTTLDFQPGKHLKIDLVDDYERLELSGRRLFTANLFDVRVAWYFTSRFFCDTVGQGQDVRNDLSLYPSGVAPRSGTLATQYLIGYQVNPWTVLHAGSSEGYLETADSQFLPQQRTFFLKASYYFQP